MTGVCLPAQVCGPAGSSVCNCAEAAPPTAAESRSHYACSLGLVWLCLTLSEESQRQRTDMSASTAALVRAALGLLLLPWARGSVLHRHAPGAVRLGRQEASSFLSRSLLYNSWDFELVVRDNLERECMEEICSYEEAREVFEDTDQTDIFWKEYSSGNAPRVDVSGLVAGILALLVSAVIAAVLGIYCYKARHKSGRSQNPVRMAGDGRPAAEMVPLSGIVAPGLPSYNEALTRSGQHDAPPPPYSGGAPSEMGQQDAAAEEEGES